MNDNQALRIASKIAKHFNKDEQAFRASLKFAVQNGSSLREVANTMGISFNTAKRIYEGR